jgi:hypothetical protein
MFGGTMTRVLDSSLVTVQYIGKLRLKMTEKLQKDMDTMGEKAIEKGQNPDKRQ